MKVSKNILLTVSFDLVRVVVVGFYGISTIVGYLMPNPQYTYFKYMICKHLDNILRRT